MSQGGWNRSLNYKFNLNFQQKISVGAFSVYFAFYADSIICSYIVENSMYI